MFLLKNKLALYVLSALIFLAASIYITYPLIFHLGNFITGYGDQYLHAWIMNWDIHKLFTDPLHIFSGTIYYPYINSLAYSDAFITSAILAIEIGRAHV